MKFQAFKEDLIQKLGNSSGSQRADWAKTIVMESIAVEDLFELLDSDTKTAGRFLWLLSNVGIWDKQHLKRGLPQLLQLSKKYEHLSMNESLISYWRHTGVPEEDESEAINLMFSVLCSSAYKTTYKSRALWALEPLMEKYPDLIPEYSAILMQELGKYSKDYDKRINKALENL